MAGIGIWTSEREQALRTLFNLGASASECALKLSMEFGFPVTRNAVIGVWHRRKWTGGVRKESPNRPRGEPRQADALAKRVRVKIIKPSAPAMPRQNKTIQRLISTGNGSFRLIDTIEQEHGVEPLRDVFVEPLHLSLVDLQYDQCRYPYGDGHFTFCGCQVVPGRPYCEPHQQLCSEKRTTEHERRRAASKRTWEQRRAKETEAA